MSLLGMHVKIRARAVANLDTCVKAFRSLGKQEMQLASHDVTLPWSIETVIVASDFKYFDRHRYLVARFRQLADDSWRQRCHGNQVSHGPEINIIEVVDTLRNSGFAAISFRVNGEAPTYRPDYGACVYDSKRQTSCVKAGKRHLIACLSGGYPQSSKKRADCTYSAHPSAPVRCRQAGPVYPFVAAQRNRTAEHNCCVFVVPGAEPFFYISKHRPSTKSERDRITLPTYQGKQRSPLNMQIMNVNMNHKLIQAALQHLALERIATCVLPVPDTDPPLFVAAGPASSIVRILQDVMSEAAAPRALADVEHDDSEGGHHD